MGKARWKLVLEEKLVSPRREVPATSLGGNWILDSAATPTSELEALMMTAPGGHAPEVAPSCRTDPYEALERHTGVSLGLTEFEMAVCDARAIAGLSYREIGKLLGCSASTAHRTYTALFEKILKKIGST